MMPKHDAYVIWSNEHRSWWKPGERGYTQVMSRAGRYSKRGAEIICEGANAYLPAGHEPNEVMLLAPECLTLTTPSA